MLKTVLNAVFVTTGLVLLVSVIIVIIYTSIVKSEDDTKSSSSAQYHNAGSSSSSSSSSAVDLRQSPTYHHVNDVNQGHQSPTVVKMTHDDSNEALDEGDETSVQRPRHPAPLMQQMTSSASGAQGGVVPDSGTTMVRCRMTPFVVDGQTEIRMRQICYEDPPTTDDLQVVPT